MNGCLGGNLPMRENIANLRREIGGQGKKNHIQNIYLNVIQAIPLIEAGLQLEIFYVS